MCESCSRRGRLIPDTRELRFRPSFAELEQQDLAPWQREMDNQIRRMVNIQMKYQNARLEMDIIRVLARFPWYLHAIAKNPHVWAIFKRPRNG
jgi:hypothetical protein